MKLRFIFLFFYGIFSQALWAGADSALYQLNLDPNNPFNCPYYRPNLTAQWLGGMMESLRNVYTNIIGNPLCTDMSPLNKIFSDARKTFKDLADQKEQLDEMVEARKSTLWTPKNERDFLVLIESYLSNIRNFKARVFSNPCTQFATNSYMGFKYYLTYWVGNLEKGLLNPFKSFQVAQKKAKPNPLLNLLPGIANLNIDSMAANMQYNVPGFGTFAMNQKRSLLEQNANNLRVIFDNGLAQLITPQSSESRAKFLESSCNLYANYQEFLNLLEEFKILTDVKSAGAITDKIEENKSSIKHYRNLKEAILMKNSAHYGEYKKAEALGKNIELHKIKFLAFYQELFNGQSDTVYSSDQCRNVISYLYKGEYPANELFNHIALKPEDIKPVESSYYNQEYLLIKPFLNEINPDLIKNDLARVNEVIKMFTLYLENLKKRDDFCLANNHKGFSAHFKTRKIMLDLVKNFDFFYNVAQNKMIKEELFYQNNANQEACIFDSLSKKNLCYSEVEQKIYALIQEAESLEGLKGLADKNAIQTFLLKYLPQVKSNRVLFTQNSHIYLQWLLEAKWSLLNPFYSGQPEFFKHQFSLKKLDLFFLVPLNMPYPVVEPTDLDALFPDNLELPIKKADSSDELLDFFGASDACPATYNSCDEVKKETGRNPRKICGESDIPSMVRYQCEIKSDPDGLVFSQKVRDLFEQVQNGWRGPSECEKTKGVDSFKCRPPNPDEPFECTQLNLPESKKKDCRCRRLLVLQRKLEYALGMVNSAKDFCSAWGELHTEASDAISVAKENIFLEEFLKDDLTLWELSKPNSGSNDLSERDVVVRKDLENWCIKKEVVPENAQYHLTLHFANKIGNQKNVLWEQFNRLRKQECPK